MLPSICLSTHNAKVGKGHNSDKINQIFSKNNQVICSSFPLSSVSRTSLQFSRSCWQDFIIIILHGAWHWKKRIFFNVYLIINSSSPISTPCSQTACWQDFIFSFNKGHNSKTWFFKVNQVIFSPFSISIPSFKVLAWKLFEISCWKKKSFTSVEKGAKLWIYKSNWTKNKKSDEARNKHMARKEVLNILTEYLTFSNLGELQP